ncbi:MAG: tetratricopeptide repeat protein [Alphaproteobacteria bacterium]
MPQASPQLMQAAIDHLFRFDPLVVATTHSAMAQDPEAFMPKALRGYLGLMASERRDAFSGVRALQGARPETAEERAHAAAIDAWIKGDWHAASRILDARLAEAPTDALALLVGHQLDFFLGEARSLRDRVARALPHYEGERRGYVLGMSAFGLEECGDYRQAEADGMAALDSDPQDVWAIHALTHVNEMLGRTEAGLGFLEARRPSWTRDTLLRIHCTWHRALFGLELMDHEGSFAALDTVLTGPDTGDSALSMADAGSLLWRLHLDGVDVGDRWTRLADAWAAKDSAPWYVFNDLHALLAFIGAGRMTEASQRLAELEDLVRAPGGEGSNWLATATAGLAVARGLLAFARQDHGAVVRYMAPVRHQLSIFGGSHAQRDVFQRTLLVSAIRAGETALARNLCAERLADRPASVWAGLQMKALTPLDR